MPRLATLLVLISMATGCTSHQQLEKGLPAEIKPATRVVPGCVQLSAGWHCQEFVPAPHPGQPDRQRVPGILL